MDIRTNSTVGLLTSRVDHLLTAIKKRLQLSKREETDSSKHLQNNRNTQFTYLAGKIRNKYKANNYKSVLEYIGRLKIGTSMAPAWHLTLAAGMSSQKEIIRIDSSSGYLGFIEPHVSLLTLQY